MAYYKTPFQEDKIVEFCRRNQITRLALFGSVLSDRFDPDSDVDVLTFAPDAQIGFLAFGRIQRELSALLKRPVDLVPQDGLKPIIRKSVLENAEVLYEVG
ncbi:MAG: nucleotidyltransferase domain-containing protein [Anaerolineales bacterium]|jgi:predicted nucleotidyltransferase